MSRTRNDDDIRSAFSALRNATAPPASTATLRRAHTNRSGRTVTPKRPHRWLVRPVVLAIVGTSIVGTATAAISTGYPMSAFSSGATTDAPAARNLGPLLQSISDLPDRINTTDQGLKVPTAALPPAGSVRGATITRDGVTLDAAVNNEQICFAPRTDITPQGQLGCFSLSVKNTDLPTITGRDSKRVWLTTVVPDDISDIAVTAADGRTDHPPVKSNLAIAVFPGAARVASIAWTNADGTRITHDLGAVPPGADPNGSVLRMNHP